MSFSLTRKTDYALVALARLAQQEADGGPPVSARQIAEEYELPLPLLMNVLKDLNRAEMVASRRGAGGGYYLQRPADQISLREVVNHIEGPVGVTACCEDGLEDDDQCLGCRLTGKCPITGAMRRLNDLLVSFLDRMTLADMMRDDLRLSLQITRLNRDNGQPAEQRRPLLEVF
jgi:Rrf2 family protein